MGNYGPQKTSLYRESFLVFFLFDSSIRGVADRFSVDNLAGYLLNARKGRSHSEEDLLQGVDLLIEKMNAAKKPLSQSTFVRLICSFILTLSSSPFFRSRSFPSPSPTTSRRLPPPPWPSFTPSLLTPSPTRTNPTPPGAPLRRAINSTRSSRPSFVSSRPSLPSSRQSRASSFPALTSTATWSRSSSSFPSPPPPTSFLRHRLGVFSLPALRRSAVPRPSAPTTSVPALLPGSVRSSPSTTQARLLPALWRRPGRTAWRGFSRNGTSAQGPHLASPNQLPNFGAAIVPHEAFQTLLSHQDIPRSSRHSRPTSPSLSSLSSPPSVFL